MPANIPNLPAHHRALQYADAVDAGLEPRSYESSDVPVGELIAGLDFKAWGKNQNLMCYFSTEAGERYRLSAWWNEERGSRYTPRDGIIDFSEPGIEGRKFRLTIGRTKTGSPSWLSACPIVTD